MYALNKKPNVNEENGVIGYKTEFYDDSSDKLQSELLIIDDKKVKGSDLAQRRLTLYIEGAKLYKIKKAVFGLGDFLYLANTATWFIDSNGNLFRHKRAYTAKLTFSKINKVIAPKKGMGSILEVEGVPHRFRTILRVDDSHQYAGVLSLYKMKFLYGTYDKKYRDTIRKV